MPDFLNSDNTHGRSLVSYYPGSIHDPQTYLHPTHRHVPRQQVQSAFAAIRERLEQRLAVESAAVSRLGKSREAATRRTEREEEVREREAATRDGEACANHVAAGLMKAG